MGSDSYILDWRSRAGSGTICSSMTGFLTTPRRRLREWRVARRADVAATLFVDLAATRSRLAGLIDTRAPEFQSGKNPYGTARTLRFLFILTIAFVLLVVALFALTIQFGEKPGDYWPGSGVP
jgi:hypothetical protein